MERHQELPSWVIRGLVALAIILMFFIPVAWTQMSSMRGLVQRSAEELRADGKLPPYVMTGPPAGGVASP